MASTRLGGQTEVCNSCGEAKTAITNPDLVGRTDIAEMMSGMTVRFFDKDGPITITPNSGTFPYGIRLACACVFPLELDFEPPLGVELPCPQHDDQPFEVLIAERLDLP
ncbi:hypothetical protein [Ornithinimicrobium panacihumi]|uniref:hypothetical protein n=1 Tax=Ornithinimicrobium panacihumi TaxID=2008449 RepID=UPI003F896080